jgi:hypothetical protein
MTASFLEEAHPAATTPNWEGAADLGVDCESRAFAAAVLDPNSKAKLVVETSLDGDDGADVTIVVSCPEHDDVRVDVPVGDVAGFANLLIDSMREAGEVAEDVAAVDKNGVLSTTIRERDALVQLVLQWQNRKDGGPRPDAADVDIKQLLADAEANAERAAAINGHPLQGAVGPG